MTLFIWGRKNRNLKHAVQHVFYSELPLCQQYRGRQRWFLLKISLQTFALYYVHNVTALEQFMPQSRLRPQSIICLKCFTIRNSFCLWGSLSLSQPHPLITARSKKKQKTNFIFWEGKRFLQLLSKHTYYTDYFCVFLFLYYKHIFLSH